MHKLLQTLLLFLMISIGAFSQPPPPNGTFEAWTDSLPDSWTANNSGDSLVPITMTTDAHGGIYALRGDVFDFHGGYVPPSFRSASTSGLGSSITTRYNALVGWYKSDLVGANYITVQITIFAANGLSIGIAYDHLDAAAAYTKFYIPIGYTNNSAARYALIEIAMADTTGLGFNLGSNYIFDDLHLEFTAGVNEINNAIFAVAPNPVSHQLNINGEFKAGQPYEISLFNSIGEKVFTKCTSTSLTSLPPIDVSTLPEGNYLLYISDSKSASSQKVLISH